ncbi:MAG: helicase, partial [Rhodobiaceae bacterium]|nr:helicase [Rhodobiaceae bacterium]
IGMGLNLEVNHVAFASDRKFDGFQHRRLTPAEFGQIAGRAGRYLTDGTFGVTGRTPPFDQDLVERIESHDFEPLQVLQWRNSDLDFTSPEDLVAALEETPRQPGLTRAPHGADRLALDAALRDAEIKARLKSREDLERLWSVCSVPDYRKIAPANHAELVISIYKHLSDDGTIPEEWFGAQVGFSDRVDGDIDTLSNRIAHIRTWTFVANRPDWLKDPEYWRETTRALEDRLSDALHERLTQRFVDRRTSVLMRRLQETEHLEARVEPSGELHVEDHFVGTLEGLSFRPDGEAGSEQAKAVRSAAQRVLAKTLAERAEALAAAPDTAFRLDQSGVIAWNSAPVGRLERSDDMLLPRVQIIADDQLSGQPLDKALARLQAWSDTQARTLIKPLFDLREADGLEGIARGIAFQIVEGFGILPRQDAADDLKALDQPVRAKLRQLGVRFGAYNVFVPALLKPAPRTLLAQLFAITSGTQPDLLSDILALSASGRTSVPVKPDLTEAHYRSVGYRVCGQMAVRVDILERLADIIRPLIAWRDGTTPRPDGAEPGNAFSGTVEMTSLVGCAGDDFASILKALGYRSETVKRAPAAPQEEPAVEPESTASEPTAVSPEAEAAETVADPSEVEPAGAAADVAPAPVEVDPPVAAEATEAAVEIASPPVEIALSATPEVAAGTATEPVPAEAVSETSPSPSDENVEMTDAAVVEVAEATENAAADPEAAELVEVVIWRPRGPDRRPQRGPRREQGEARPDRKPNRQRPAEGKGRGKRRGGKPEHGPGPQGGRKPDPRPPREPVIDPDSPFAALAALKEKMRGDS